MRKKSLISICVALVLCLCLGFSTFSYAGSYYGSNLQINVSDNSASTRVFTSNTTYISARMDVRVYVLNAVTGTGYHYTQTVTKPMTKTRSLTCRYDEPSTYFTIYTFEYAIGRGTIDGSQIGPVTVAS